MHFIADQPGWLSCLGAAAPSGNGQTSTVYDPEPVFRFGRFPGAGSHRQTRCVHPAGCPYQSMENEMATVRTKMADNILNGNDDEPQGELELETHMEQEESQDSESADQPEPGQNGGSPRTVARKRIVRRPPNRGEIKADDPPAPEEAVRRQEESKQATDDSRNDNPRYDPRPVVEIGRAHV